MKNMIGIALITMCLCYLAVGTQVELDPQIAGFNHTNFSSGPIVVVDERTLYVSDFRNFGPNKEIEFYATTYHTPYNDTEAISIYNGSFTKYSSNIYITLPESVDITKITYLKIIRNDEVLDYTKFRVSKSRIKAYNPKNMEDSIFRIPKCCGENQHLNTQFENCSEAEVEQDLNIPIFESNQTGLDPDNIIESDRYQIIPYYQFMHCKPDEQLVQITEIHGLIYNSSLIVKEVGIFAHRDFCIDNLQDTNGNLSTLTLICIQVPNKSDPNFYLPCLIISTICFAAAAAAYWPIMSEEYLYKRCFFMYSFFMCLAFLCLIFMQVQSNKTTCNTFGFIFIFTFTLGFLWLLMLCFELLYEVTHEILEERWAARWIYYCFILLGLSLIFLMISLFSGEKWVPDVPSSFIMNYGHSSQRCHFETTFSRAFITFTPMLFSICGSLLCLIWLLTCIKITLTTYIFLSRTCILVLIVACFWILNVFFYDQHIESGHTQLALDVIKATLGLVSFVSFVCNKYAVREIKNCGKKSVDVQNIDESVSLNRNPIFDDDYNNQRQTNTTFQNNRALNGR